MARLREDFYFAQRALENSVRVEQRQQQMQQMQAQKETLAPARSGEDPVRPATQTGATGTTTAAATTATAVTTASTSSAASTERPSQVGEKVAATITDPIPTPTPVSVYLRREPRLLTRLLSCWGKDLESLEDLKERRKFYDALNEGNAARDAANYDAAERAYALAMLFVPHDARAYHGLGNVYADQRKWDEAEKAYRRALVSNPHFGLAHAALGFVLSQPEAGGGDNPARLAAAESSLWRAAELENPDDKVYDLIVNLMRRRGASGDEMLKAHARAATFSPFSVKVRLLLGDALARAGKRKEAAEQLRTASEIGKAPRDLVLVAGALESERNYRKAEQLLRRALAVEPRHPQALYDLGRVLVLRKRYAACFAQLLKEAVEASPRDFAPRFLLALTYLKRGQPEDAERTLDAAVNVAAAEARERLALAYGFGSTGDAYAGASRPRDAARAYERALELDPEDTETKDKLSEVRARFKP